MHAESPKFFSVVFANIHNTLSSREENYMKLSFSSKSRKKGKKKKSFG